MVKFSHYAHTINYFVRKVGQYYIFSTPCSVQELEKKKGGGHLLSDESLDTYFTAVTELVTPMDATRQNALYKIRFYTGCFEVMGVCHSPGDCTDGCCAWM